MVKNGDKVKMGQPLIEFDIDKIKAAGYDTTTMLVVTNHNDYDHVKIINTEAIEKIPFLELEVGTV